MDLRKRIAIAAALVAAMTAVLFCATSIVAASGNAGTMNLKVTTRATNGKYAPKHVLAAWVTDARGQFVRTLLVRGRKRKKYLYRWAKDTKKNNVDAVTGATLKSHGEVAIRWDCRDTQGDVVPDGEYRIQLELTDKHAQGPTTPAGHIVFIKGGKPATAKPEDQDNFRSMSLSYTPGAAKAVSPGR
jgi:hypothetical protein